MKIRSLAGSLAAAALLSCATLAHAGVLVPIPPVPGSTATSVQGINNLDMITGSFTNTDGVKHGFVGALDGAYTSFDYGKAQDTEPRAINDDGLIVGYSYDVANNFYGPEFVRTRAGNMRTVKKDGQRLTGAAHGVNKKGLFVGEYWETTGAYVAYGYYGRGASYRRDLTLPFNTDRTRPRGINKHGIAVGWFRDNDGGGRYRGFVLSDGKATTIDYPDQNAFYVYVEGINDKGMAVGYWQDQNLTFAKSFLFDTVHGTFHDIDVPAATFVYSGGINNADIVTLNVDGQPYLYCKTAKSCPGGIHGISLPDVSRPAALGTTTLVCGGGCLSRRRISVLASRPTGSGRGRSIARDPELQREVKLLFRP